MSTRTNLTRRQFAATLTAAAVTPRLSFAAETADWPQWHGPNRDNLSTETGLLKEWLSGGPKLLWTAKGLGHGYGSLAIAGDHIHLLGGRNPHWLLSESPLIDGNKIIVTPGGRGAGMVALDKTTGKEIWKCAELSVSAGYASCIIADVHNVRTIMNLTSESGVGVRASD